MITITESAQEYLGELLSKQEDALGVRVFINQPGTPRAETCIAYCREGDLQEGDEERQYKGFKAWFDARSLPYLEDALVDFPGCAVVISHDRWFLDRIATHILAFEGDSHVEWFEGNYQDYEKDYKRRKGADADQPHRIKYRRIDA